MEQSHCQRVLGKTIDTLQYKDVVKYFKSPRKESETLEFKSYDLKDVKDSKEHERKVYETICAFLNSSGGLLIWGAPAGIKVSGEDEKTFSGELIHVKNDLEPDMLTDRINGRITPTPPIIRHTKLKGEGKQVYVIEVDKSSYAPHQIDGTYFVRLFGQTRKAPHYMVEAMMRRIVYPELRAGFRVLSVSSEGGGKTINFRVGVSNQSRLQNEHDLIVAVTAYGGMFEHNVHDIHHTRTLHMNNQRMIKKTSLLTLHHGHIHIEQDSIKLPSSYFQDEVKIDVAVGGRLSPWRVSTYLVDPLIGVSDYKKYVRKIVDNILVADLEENELLESEWSKYS